MAEEKQESKTELKYINLYEHKDFNDFKKNIPEVDKDNLFKSYHTALNDNDKELNSFITILDKAIERTQEDEGLLLKEIGNGVVNEDETLNWITVFKYLQKQGDEDNLDYWVKILKDISSSTFINSFLNKSNLKKISDSSSAYASNKKLKDEKVTTLTRPKLFTNQIKAAFNKIEAQQSYKGGKINFDPYKGGKEISNTIAREVINGAVESYDEALKNALKLMGCPDKDQPEKIKIAKKAITEVYVEVYKTMYKRVQLRMNLGLNSFVEKEINKRLSSIQKEFSKKELNYKSIVGTYSYHTILLKYTNSSKQTFEMFLSGDTIDVYEIEDKNQQNTKDFDEQLNKMVDKKDASAFISSLVNFFLNFIVSFEGQAQSKKEAPDITDDGIEKNMIALLTENYNQYLTKFNATYGKNSKNKDGNDVKQAYLISLFGNKGAKNRASTIQGTMGELLFSTLLSLRIDGLTKQQYEEKMNSTELSEDDKRKLRAVYINGQQVNKESQQAHDDIVVIIDNKKIGIQVKQYNSKNLSTEGVKFYGEEYNFFGSQALTTKGLGRYISKVCEEFGINYKDFIINLRALSFTISKQNQTIDISNEMYPFFLNFARIKDDLEELESEASRLTYNNFYVYNFAMIPTSLILKKIKENIMKEQEEKKNKTLSGIFQIKPTKVTENGGLVLDKENYNLVTMIGNKKYTAEGNLNFVGLTVNPSQWYNFEGF